MESATKENYKGTKSEAKRLLRLYQIGSLVVLICGLLAVSLVCSINFANREGRRSQIYEKQIKDFFGVHYRRIAEEMWTRNYESIRYRVEQTSKQLGSDVYNLKLVDEKGRCVFYGTNSAKTLTCKVAPSEKRFVKKAASQKDAVATLRFDYGIERYRYATPLYVGSVYKGVLLSNITDSYGFHQGQNLSRAMGLFVVSGSAVLLLWLLWLWASRRFILGRYTSVLASLEKKEALAKLAAQLSHDIRSPLSALTILVDSARSSMPPSQSQLLQLAISRITSIADELLNKYRNPSGQNRSTHTILSGVVHSIISEKTVLLQGSDIELSASVTPDCDYSVVKMDTDRIQRCLSNLVNNAMDAFDEQGGNISIELTRQPKTEMFNQEMVSLVVRDNGKGMDARTLQKVRTKGGSFGKKTGHGIGLNFAKEVAAEIGGQLTIQSEKGKGTEVRLLLPVAPTPDWLQSGVQVAPDTTFVILDDDESMHALWKERLVGFRTKHLRDPEEFSTEAYPPSRCIYLLDHEILGAPITGLDLIKMYHLRSRAFLVTSYFADSSIQTQLERVGAHLLPKFLASKFYIETVGAADPFQSGDGSLFEANSASQGQSMSTGLSGALFLMSPLV